jgi:lipoate-protein ligase A
VTPLGCRLLIEGPGLGARQMAVDETLLETAAQTHLATLRFYQWSEPTLSLGYFQAIAERQQHAASQTCAVVRRQTGGGAILHDRELTYSLALPCAHPLAGDATSLYEAVHDALILVLASNGLAARRLATAGEVSAAPPFLCFERRSVGDVLIADVKICGSAQRRRRGAILQHGSLLLARSPFAPQLHGLDELGDNPIEPGELIDTWRRAIGQSLGLAFEAGQLSPGEIASCVRLEREKYAHVDWTARR